MSNSITPLPIYQIKIIPNQEYVNGVYYHFWAVLKLADHDWFNYGHGLEDSIEKAFNKANKYYSKLVKENENSRGNRSKMSIYEDSAGEKVKEELRRLL